MQSAVPKQFIELKGKPVLMHTIEKFKRVYPEIQIIVVHAKELKDDWKALCEKHNFNIDHVLADGGETRFHSVKNGLEFVSDPSVVGIHDAARPLVSMQTIKNSFEIAEENGNACPAVPVTDSLRYLKG